MYLLRWVKKKLTSLASSRSKRGPPGAIKVDLPRKVGLATSIVAALIWPSSVTAK